MEGRNDVLTEKLLACETRVRELEEYKSQHQNVWGALSAEELTIFAKAGKLLLQQDPVAFMEKNHDAIFNRKVIEENKVRYGIEMKSMTLKLETAKARVPALEEEVAVLKRKLLDQKQQTKLQFQRAESLEEELAVAEYQLKMCNMRWMEAGNEVGVLEQSVERLKVENESLKARSTRVPVRVPVASVQNSTISFQDEVDCVTMSLYAKIKELKAKCQKK